MKALLLFHIRVGVRVAVRSFTPLFSALLALVMLQMYPAAVVAGLARSVYAHRPAFPDIALAAALAFALPAWAAPRLSHGLNGWLRHLSIPGVGNRRGLTLALVVVEMPLAMTLGILGVAAQAQGISPWPGALRWILVMLAAALAATPARRRIVSTPIALASAALVLLGNWGQVLLAAVLLVVADAMAGAVREKPPARHWSAAGPLLDFRIAWRALGWRVLPGYMAGLIALAAAALFIFNNQLSGAFASGAVRFGGGAACVFCVTSLAQKLGVRRPVWPLARSFPRSSAQRIIVDALFLGVHALPLAFLVALRDVWAALALTALLPLLCLRAAAFIRRIPGRRTGSGACLAEGLFLSALLALLPWSALILPAAAVPAFFSALDVERGQKVTRWMELHHVSAGDTLSWGER